MDNPVRSFVAKLTDSQKQEIIANYMQFERDGFIGDVELRVRARELVELLGIQPNGMIVMWMEKLAFSVYQEFYEKINLG